LYAFIEFVFLDRGFGRELNEDYLETIASQLHAIYLIEG
jgi:hypothetical protein